jgi:hypothetical protein
MFDSAAFRAAMARLMVQTGYRHREAGVSAAGRGQAAP